MSFESNRIIRGILDTLDVDVDYMLDGEMDGWMVSNHRINRVYIVSEESCSRWPWAGTGTGTGTTEVYIQ